MVGVGIQGAGSPTLSPPAPLAVEFYCGAKNVLGFLGGGHIGSLSDRSIVPVSDGLGDWAVVSNHVCVLIVCANPALSWFLPRYQTSVIALEVVDSVFYFFYLSINLRLHLHYSLICIYVVCICA